jgi:REP element-mobilizing transposase RayT
MLFWKKVIPENFWLDDLKIVTKQDGVRIYSHKQQDSNTSMFLLSAGVSIPPFGIIKSVKGRLQHLISSRQPKAFSRNYSIHSVGETRSDEIERYVATQLDRHRMSDPKTEQAFRKAQLDNHGIDLNKDRKSAHGIFTHNLHIVIVNAHRYIETDPDILAQTSRIVRAVADKKKHLLSKVTPAPGHFHLTVGCGIEDAPGDVALGYMNNLVFARQMRPIYQNGFYVATFGRYDLGAIFNNLKNDSLAQ